MTAIILTMIIERPHEVERINSLKNWTMIYGRRKTGKTFLVKRYMDWDDYFFVKRDRTILDQNNESMTYDTFINILRRNIGENKVTVVDEFHRLGDDFFDLLHSIGDGGRVILVSSTLYLSKRFFTSGSPLTGLFAEIPMPIIDLKDTLRSTEEMDKDPKERLELALILREPLAARFVKDMNARELLGDMILFSRQTIPALVGEIFSEEERRLSGIYEGILRAVADGTGVSSGISSYLFSRRLIDKDDPSIIQNHLNNLMKVGILKRIKVYNKNRFVYKHASPLTNLFYYADEKYNITERELTSSEIKDIIHKKIPYLIEDAVREHLAKKEGMEEAVIQSSDMDMDVCLLKFNKPKVIGEIKWRTQIRSKDLSRAEDVLSRFDADRKFFFVPDKRDVSSDVLEVMDVTDL